LNVDTAAAVGIIIIIIISSQRMKQRMKRMNEDEWGDLECLYIKPARPL